MNARVMKDWKILVCALGIAALSAYTGYRVSAARPATAATASSSDPAHLQVTADSGADIRVQDLEGREHSLSEWSGKILVVNFWATWCPPCVVEIPGFIELQAAFGDRGLQFVGIALDDPAAAARFSNERGINYPILAGEDNVARLMEGLGNTIGALPYTVVFDRDGSVLHTHQGEWPLDAARALLEPLLESAPANRQVAR